MDFYEQVDSARVKLVLNADNLPFEDPESANNCKKSLGMYLKRKVNKDSKRKIHHNLCTSYNYYDCYSNCILNSFLYELKCTKTQNQIFSKVYKRSPSIRFRTREYP